MPTANLTSLGFTETKSTAEKITSPNYCKNLFSVDGACVSENAMKKMLEDQQNNLFKITAIKKNVADILSKIEEAVQTDASKVAKIQAIKTSLDTSQTPCF